MSDTTRTSHPTIDWADWLRCWDPQQEAYLPDREERVVAVPDILDLHVLPAFLALDIACGPGAIAQRRDNRILLAIR